MGNRSIGHPGKNKRAEPEQYGGSYKSINIFHIIAVADLSSNYKLNL
jgi:hypothetical protein